MPGRSPVFGTNAMVASSHPLASETAIAIMRKGGNAIDAAIAAAAVLAVVEPAMTGIGGDCFALVSRQSKPLVAINGSGRAPRAIEPQKVLDQQLDTIPEEHPLSVTIPGAVDAWDRLLKDFGTMGFDEVLQPAIRYAEEGFAVAPRVAYDWELFAPKLAAHDTTRDIYLRGGKPPRAGDVHYLPVLAKTLRNIAEKGRDGFYLGKNSEAMAASLRELGGVHTAEDFANHKSDYIDPVLNLYRDTDIAEIPPNTQGITAQLILNILENFDLASLDPHGVERYHLELEAARSAFRYSNAFIADPGSMQITVEEILSTDLARQLAKDIDILGRTEDFGPVVIPKGSDTIYLTVVDANWTAISFINSIYSAFGSRITDPQTGVLFHCRGACFSTDPRHPNFIGPNKRPMHTIIPAMAFLEGRCDLSFGVMGGAYQPLGQAHVVSNVYDYGMDIQQAIDHPRVFWQDGKIGFERGLPDGTRDGLAKCGHELVKCQDPWGGGQGITLDWERGVLVGGSDPRKDGCAIGF